MNPSDYAKSGTEHSQQVALFMRARQSLEDFPELEWMYAIPNGGKRSVSEAASLKAEGVKSGVSDVCLPAAKCGYHGLYIEMKKPGNLKGESDKQKEFGAYLKEQGYYYQCCDTYESAWDVVFRYVSGVLTNV